MPPPEEIWEAETATLERLRAGVPIEDTMAAFRLSIASIQDRLVEPAAEIGVDSGHVAAGAEEDSGQRGRAQSDEDAHARRVRPHRQLLERNRR